MRVLLFFLVCSVASGQFVLQQSPTTASLRGVDAVSDTVAWVSGDNGTVARTLDGGKTWTACAVPKGAAKLDFRGVQGFDAQTAVVMASGKGPLSAIYKTTDGCATWKMVFANPDADGFFDAVRKVTATQMYLLGDPVAGKFSMFYSSDAGSTWFIADDPGLDAEKGDGAFAASNSSLMGLGNTVYFGTGGGASAHLYGTYAKCAEGAAKDQACPLAWGKVNVPLAAGVEGAGVFSIAGRVLASQTGKLTSILVAVGGDYTKPDAVAGTVASSRDGGKTWAAPETGVRGYRSAVVYDRETLRWLAVGPNGVDGSKDDGKHWFPLAPQGAGTESDQGWNAVSLPFAVGAKGQIGRLRDGALAGASR